MHMAENDSGRRRLGISVGKSVGGAVVRNRMKRLLREAFRLCRLDLPAGYDYVLMYSRRFVNSTEKEKRNLKLQQVRSALMQLAGYAHRKTEKQN